MSQHHLKLVSVLFLASSLTACGAGGGSLPGSTNAGSSSAGTQSGFVRADSAAVSALPQSTTAYPTYSQAFTANTPFHHTVGALVNFGATKLSSTIANNYWSEGIAGILPARETGGVGPLYTVSSGDPAYTFSCPAYGSKCSAAGLISHFPVGAQAQTGTDHHLSSFDPVYLKGEIDGWGGGGNPNEACNLNPGNPGTATCAWAGFFPFSGDGLAHGGSSGQAGGYALGLMTITAQELLQGHIDHAIGIDQSCLDNGGVYPSKVGRPTDVTCPASQEPNVKYGQMIHLKSSVNINDLGYSKYCVVIAKALQTYGAYTASNNAKWGIALNFEYMNNYTGSNPWFDTIFPSMVAGGDGKGIGTSFAFNSCLNRLTASDIEVIQITPNLPAMPAT